VGQAPGKNPYTVTLSAPSSKNGTYDSPTVNDTYTHYAFSGDFGPVMANVTYKLVSGQYFSDCCKAMTQRTLQLVGWDIKPELGIKLPIPGDFLDMGITVEYKGDTNPNFLVFNDMPATDHKQWSANLYLQNVAPNSTSFTGGVTATTYYYIDNPPPAIHGTWVAGDPKYTPYYNQEVDFISGGSGSYSDEYDWTTINTDCCPCQN
jgi:hypothetical protein